MIFNRILSFSLAIAAGLVFACKCNAATTGTVTITGMVPAICAVVVTPDAGATNIADISAGDTNRLIATVTETCNDPDGYTMTVVGSHSTNHTGLFVDSVSGASQPFTITYNNVAVPTGGVVTSTSAPGIGVAKPVKITYGANSSLTPSVGYTYSETLTFTIAAK